MSTILWHKLETFRNFYSPFKDFTVLMLSFLPQALVMVLFVTPLMIKHVNAIITATRRLRMTFIINIFQWVKKDLWNPLKCAINVLIITAKERSDPWCVIGTSLLHFLRKSIVARIMFLAIDWPLLPQGMRENGRAASGVVSRTSWSW